MSEHNHGIEKRFTITSTNLANTITKKKLEIVQFLTEKRAILTNMDIILALIRIKEFVMMENVLLIETVLGIHGLNGQVQ